MIDDAELRAAWLRARARWTGVEVDEAKYRTFVDERGGDVANAAGDELYLVCACASGDAAAIRLFEQTYFDEVERILRKERKPELRDELEQQLRMKLFVSRDGRDRAIDSFGGRGPLRRWFRMICARTLINLATRGGPEIPASDEFIADMIGGDSDPELEYIKTTYRRAFREAFDASFAGLDPQSQSLLRAAFRDNLTVDAMGSIHGVHRSTVARWVVRAHRDLVRAIRSRLMTELRMSRSEVDSMFQLIFSRMDITLGERVTSEGSGSGQPSSRKPS
jgi:RNA polymerase sigma-70 factor